MKREHLFNMGVESFECNPVDYLTRINAFFDSKAHRFIERGHKSLKKEFDSFWKTITNSGRLKDVLNKILQTIGRKVWHHTVLIWFNTHYYLSSQRHGLGSLRTKCFWNFFSSLEISWCLPRQCSWNLLWRLRISPLLSSNTEPELRLSLDQLIMQYFPHLIAKKR